MNIKKLFAIIMIFIISISSLSIFAESNEVSQNNELLSEDNKNVEIATVNGKPVTQGDVDIIFNNIINQYSMYGINTDDESLRESIYQDAIQSAIQKEVILQKANELGLDQVTDEEMQTFKNNALNNWKSVLDSFAQNSGLTEQSTDEEKTEIYKNSEETLKELGYTEEAFLESEILGNTLKNVEIYLTKDINVNDDEIIEKYNSLVEADKLSYENNLSEFEINKMNGASIWFIPSGFRGIKHILLNVDSELLNKYADLNARFEEGTVEPNIENYEQNNAAEETEEQVPVTKEEIDEVRNEIFKSVENIINEINTKIDAGQSFDELIVEYGKDPGMTQEPYKTDGYMIFKESQIYDPAFTKAAFELNKVGDIGNPILGMYGVHILYYAKDFESGPVELTDENKEIVKQNLLNEKKGLAIQDGIASWKNDFEIIFK